MHCRINSKFGRPQIVGSEGEVEEEELSKF